jgi:hypothetical protein
MLSLALLPNKRKFVEEVTSRGTVSATDGKGNKCIRRNRLSGFRARVPEVRVVVGHVPSDESDQLAADVKRKVDADLHDDARRPRQTCWLCRGEGGGGGALAGRELGAAGLIHVLSKVKSSQACVCTCFARVKHQRAHQQTAAHQLQVFFASNIGVGAEEDVGGDVTPSGGRLLVM